MMLAEVMQCQSFRMKSWTSSRRARRTPESVIEFQPSEETKLHVANLIQREKTVKLVLNMNRLNLQHVF